MLIDLANRTHLSTTLNSSQSQYLQINGGSSEGISPGVILKKENGTDLAYVVEVEPNSALLRPMFGARIRPGDKLVPNAPTFGWRNLIKQMGASEDAKHPH